MEVVLVLNIGSTSCKYALFEPQTGLLVKKSKSETTSSTLEKTVRGLVSEVLQEHSITRVVHRIVFGGKLQSEALQASPEVLEYLRSIEHLAPLHNPPALHAVHLVQKLVDSVIQILVFDSAFHSTIPETESLYALPKSVSDQFSIKRYGFHGISHSYVSKLMQEKGITKVVSCHLGSGSSVCALLEGKSVATSMGFSPEEGVVMSSRVGDIGAGAVLGLLEQSKISPAKLRSLLNTESGMLAVGGASDMRVLLERVAQGDERAALGVAMFVRSVVRYIGAYVALMNGVQALVFTGGIGEGSGVIRKMICEHFGFINLELSAHYNMEPERKTQLTPLHSVLSKVLVFALPANEEKHMMELARKSV